MVWRDREAQEEERRDGLPLIDAHFFACYTDCRFEKAYRKGNISLLLNHWEWFNWFSLFEPDMSGMLRSLRSFSFLVKNEDEGTRLCGNWFFLHFWHARFPSIEHNLDA